MQTQHWDNFEDPQGYQLTPEQLAFRLRYQYMLKLEAFLAARFPSIQECERNVLEGRLERRIPEYLADWHERVLLDGEIIAELKINSYWVSPSPT